MKYDETRTCVGCRKPLSTRHFILKRRSIKDSGKRSWPADPLSFCSVECLAEGLVRLFNDSKMSDWVPVFDR